MESGNSKAASMSSEEAAVRSHSRPAVAARPDDDEDAAAMSPPLVLVAPSPRPYYECVFCKRGFTTAQALGGHMNVHRRDRPKPVRRPTAECNLALAYPPAQPVSGGGFSMLYYARHIGAGDAVSRASPIPIPRELRLFGADVGTHDHDLQLGLWCHGSGGGGRSRSPEGPSEWWRDGELPERKIDLELRLGPRPRN